MPWRCFNGDNIAPLQSQFIYISVEAFPGIFKSHFNHLGNILIPYLPQPVIGFQFGTASKIGIYPFQVLIIHPQVLFFTTSSRFQAFHSVKIEIPILKQNRVSLLQELFASAT